MPDLSAFPIVNRWPAQHPDRLQLYSFPTPNGVKVSIMLEETGLPYEPHTVNITKNESWTPEFLSLNPNGKIPAVIDPDGPGGRPVGLFESGAILLYLANKTGQLMPADEAQRWEAIQWVVFQIAVIGPMVGQVGYFNQCRRRRDRRQAAIGALRERVEAPARRHRGPARGARVDHGRGVHDRRHLDARLGAQSGRLLWRPRARRVRCAKAGGRLARARPGAARGATRAGDSEAAVIGRDRDYPAASLRAKRSNLPLLEHAFAAEIASSAFGLLAMTQYR